jgi:hypothetical protein
VAGGLRHFSERGRAGKGRAVGDAGAEVGRASRFTSHTQARVTGIAARYIWVCKNMRDLRRAASTQDLEVPFERVELARGLAFWPSQWLCRCVVRATDVALEAVHLVGARDRSGARDEAVITYAFRREAR